MARFNVYLGTLLIGSSELEYGDPPMGVAFGRFVPNDRYRKGALQNPSEVNAASLSVRTSTGVSLEASGGACIEDHSAELGAEGLELSVLGIPYPDYETMFPEHVAAYERRFKSS